MGRATFKAVERIGGDKLYQKRARQAFPLLVRQAEARKQIFYSDLADELGMPNPRNLNYVLGCVGGTITHLAKAMRIQIPPIQCLVVNRATELPGEGIGGFMKRWGDFNSFDVQQKRQVVLAAHGEVFAFPKWHEVLAAVDLDPVDQDYSGLIARATALPVDRRGGGESERHQMMKRYVAQ